MINSSMYSSGVVKQNIHSYTHRDRQTAHNHTDRQPYIQTDIHTHTRARTCVCVCVCVCVLLQSYETFKPDMIFPAFLYYDVRWRNLMLLTWNSKHNRICWSFVYSCRYHCVRSFVCLLLFCCFLLCVGLFFCCCFFWGDCLVFVIFVCVCVWVGGLCFFCGFFFSHQFIRFIFVLGCR